jgi:hypothetical protein
MNAKNRQNTAVVFKAALLCVGIVLQGAGCHQDSQEASREIAVEVPPSATTVPPRKLQFTLGSLPLESGCVVTCEADIHFMYGQLDCPDAPVIKFYSGPSMSVGANIHPGSEGYETTEEMPYGLFHLGTTPADGTVGVNLIVKSSEGLTGVNQFHSEDTEAGRQAVLAVANRFTLDSEYEPWCTER